MITEQRCACNVPSLSHELNVPDLPQLVGHFLCQQLHNIDIHEAPDHGCPRFASHVNVINHAIATFHSPSDPSNNST